MCVCIDPVLERLGITEVSSDKKLLEILDAAITLKVIRGKCKGKRSPKDSASDRKFNNAIKELKRAVGPDSYPLFFNKLKGVGLQDLRSAKKAVEDRIKEQAQAQAEGEAKS